MIQITNTLSLEPITISHQEELFSLMQEIYPPAYKHLWENEDCAWYLNYCFSKKNLANELNEAHTIYYFVLYDLKRVGIIRVIYNTSINSSAEKNATFIHRIYLSNETQGKGIGSQLFNWITLQANKKQNKFLWLKAMDTQLQALKFYKRQGFHTIDKMVLDFKLIHQKLRGMIVMKKPL